MILVPSKSLSCYSINHKKMRLSCNCSPFDLLHLTYIIQFYLSCSKLHFTIPCSHIVLHCVYIPLLYYSLICFWIFGLFPKPGCFTECCYEYKSLHIFLNEYFMFEDIYQEAELLTYNSVIIWKFQIF